MSKFADKLRIGPPPTDDDWNEYLIEFHRRMPQVTSNALTRFHTSDGQTPYEKLADEVDSISNTNPVVLDLGCGDGVLALSLLNKVGRGASVIGTDFSQEELDIAKRNCRDPRASFRYARAQALPFKDDSIDLIVSHMALMLMMPIEPVISEIARTLKKGGIFTAVMGHSTFAKGIWQEVIQLTSSFISVRYPKTSDFTMGDSRLLTNEGLRSLFRRDLGFETVSDLIEFEVTRRIGPEEVWDIIKDQYLPAMMTQTEQADLKEELKRLVSPRLEEDGRFLSYFPLRIFRVSKTR